MIALWWPCQFIPMVYFITALIRFWSLIDCVPYDFIKVQSLYSISFTLVSYVMYSQKFTTLQYWSYVCMLLPCIACQCCGYIHINGEEVEESKFDITMQMYAKKLDKKDFFGKVWSNQPPHVIIMWSQECIGNKWWCNFCVGWGIVLWWLTVDAYICFVYTVHGISLGMKAGLK